MLARYSDSTSPFIERYPLRRSRFAFGVLVASIVLAPCLSSCSGSPVRAEPPPFNPKNQSRCGITKSQARPLIVEWPSADRGELEDRARRDGLVVVRYEGCEMELLPQCKAPGSYRYSALTRKRDRITMRDTDELYATIPVGAPKLEATLQRAGELSVAMTIVGRYNADRMMVRRDELTGECGKATHVVSALTAGAFEFLAGAEAASSAGANLAGAAAGARATSRRETLAQDGDDTACERSTDTDDRPPSGCGALLRIEVVPVGGAPDAATTSQAASPAGVPPPQPAEPSASPPSTIADRDSDGVPDGVDKCPGEPEDRDQFEDGDGCPDRDNDLDGVPDADDRCPGTPETRNGYEDNDGCPDAPPTGVPKRTN